MSDAPSEDRQTRSFERWAFAGCVALAAVAITAFAAHRQDRASESPAEDVLNDRLLRVELGGGAPGPDTRRQRASDAPPPRDERSGAGGQGTDGAETDDDSASPPIRRSVQPSLEPAVREVVIQPGETLGEVVQRELGTIRRLDEVVRLNGLDSADNVRAGQRLRFPRD